MKRGGRFQAAEERTAVRKIADISSCTCHWAGSMLVLGCDASTTSTVFHCGDSARYCGTPKWQGLTHRVLYYRMIVEECAYEAVRPVSREKGGEPPDELTNLLAIESCVPKAVRSRVYRNKVPAEVEVPLEGGLTVRIQDCSGLVPVIQQSESTREPAAPSPVFIRKTSRSYDTRPASVNRVRSSVASNCTLMDCPLAISASRAVGMESCR